MNDSARPLAPYAQVKQYLKNGLAKGLWPTGVPMPSESELVAQFGVSRMTVNRALKELQAEGLVHRVQGVGSFAAPLHKVSSMLRLRDVHDEIAERGHVHQAQVHLQTTESATQGLASQLGLKPGARVFHSCIVHFENGEPLQVEDRFVNPAEAPDYLTQDFSQTTPTHYLFEATSLWRAQYTIESSLPTPQEAQWLGIAKTDPCLIVVRRTMSRHGVITLARLVHPGGRYLLEGQFEP